MDGFCEFQDSLSYRERKSYLKNLKTDRKEGRTEGGREEGVPKQDLLRAWALELEIAEFTASATN